MTNVRNLDSKESVWLKLKESLCAELCLKFWFESYWYFCKLTELKWYGTVQKKVLHDHVLKSLQKQSFKTGVLRNIAIFTGKHLYLSLCLAKLQGL